MFSLYGTKRILSLAVPLMLAALAQTAVNQVAQILAGQLPEHATEAQTAVTISQSFLWIFSSVFAALGVGTQVLVARYVGAQDAKGAGAVTTNALVFGLISSVLLTWVCWELTPSLLALSSPDAKVIELGIPFARWRFLTLPAMILTSIIKGFFDGQGKTRIGMRIALLTNVLNLFLGIALMFGSQQPDLWGVDQLHKWLQRVGSLPAWGLVGAGIAAAISSFVGVLVFFLWLFRAEYRSFGVFRLQNVTAHTAKRLFRLAIPSGLADAFTMISFLFLVIMVGYAEHHLHPSLEKTASGATSNIISILLFVFMSCIAYGTALSTLVSQSLGANRPEEASQFVHTGLVLGVGFYTLVGGFSFWGARELLHFWNSKDAAVLVVGVPILRMMLMFLPIIVIAISLMQAMYGAGNSRFVMRAQLILQFLFLFPLCYVLSIISKLGIWGAWGAMAVYAVGLAGTMYAKYRFGTWRQMNV